MHAHNPNSGSFGSYSIRSTNWTQLHDHRMKNDVQIVVLKVTYSAVIPTNYEVYRLCTGERTLH